MALLNVDPEKQADAFYRYKMPRVMTKVEGNGNGIKTVVCNFFSPPWASVTVSKLQGSCALTGSSKDGTTS